MLIDFEREGGYAPLRLSYRANTDDLPKEVAERLLYLIKSSGILELEQSDLAFTRAPPDAFSYRLIISEGGKSKSLIFNDVTAPVMSRPLLTFLQELALVKS